MTTTHYFGILTLGLICAAAMLEQNLSRGQRWVIALVATTGGFCLLSCLPFLVGQRRGSHAIHMGFACDTQRQRRIPDRHVSSDSNDCLRCGFCHFTRVEYRKDSALCLTRIGRLGCHVS